LRFLARFDWFKKPRAIKESGLRLLVPVDTIFLT
jgi:hypothetical protein